MNAPASPKPLTIPPCATCDHPAVRAFIEVVSAIDVKAPVGIIRDRCRVLAGMGYLLDLATPDEDGEIPPAPWHWNLREDGRIVSGLPIGTTLTIAPETSPSAATTLPNAQDRGSFERETPRGRQTPGRSVDPSPESRSARPAPGNTPLESSLQRTLLQ